jgi:hypothetical protein
MIITTVHKKRKGQKMSPEEIIINRGTTYLLKIEVQQKIESDPS